MPKSNKAKETRIVVLLRSVNTVSNCFVGIYERMDGVGK